MKTFYRTLSLVMVTLVFAGCSPQISPTPELPISESSPQSIQSESGKNPSELPRSNDSTPSPQNSSISSPAQEPTAPLSLELNDLGWDWFDDAVFIGDSVSLKLKNYVTKQRQSNPSFLGTAQFLTSGSLGSGNALWEVSAESVHPLFQGKKMRLEDSVALTGAKKIYLMLGINDIAVYGVDGSVEQMHTLIETILEKTPDATIYIQSATPIAEGAEKTVLNNENLTSYNEKLQTLCQENGYHYINLASTLKDDSGYLPRMYCSDPDGMGIHFTDTACEVWIHCLYTDAVIRNYNLNREEDSYEEVYEILCPDTDHCTGSMHGLFYQTSNRRDESSNYDG